MFKIKLADKKPYKASISRMRLRLAKLEKLNAKTKKIRAIIELAKGWKDINKVLYYQGLPFESEIIWIKLISWHLDNLLARYFDINQSREFIGRKNNWQSLRKDVEAYVKGRNVYLLSKTVKNKPYGNLQALLLPIHQ